MGSKVDIWSDSMPAAQVKPMLERVAGIAAEVGLDRDDVLRSLAADEFLDDVRADQDQAIEFGIQGVPFYVIDGKYGVSGAQSPETFTGVVRALPAAEDPQEEQEDVQHVEEDPRGERDRLR